MHVTVVRPSDLGQSEASLWARFQKSSPDLQNNLQGFIGSGLPIDARWAVKQAHLRGWRFNSVPVGQRAFAPFHYEGTTVPCPVIDLTKDLSHISERRKLVAHWNNGLVLSRWSGIALSRHTSAS